MQIYPPNLPEITIFLGRGSIQRRLLRCLNCGLPIAEVINDVVQITEGASEDPSVYNSSPVITMCSRCKRKYHIHILA